MILKSKGLILRPFRTEDLDALFESCLDGGSASKKHPITKKKAEAYLRKLLSRQKDAHRFAVIIDGLCCGAMSLSDIKQSHKAEAAGIWLRKKCWGQGFGTTGVKLLTQFGFKELGLRRIYAYIDKKNVASITMFEKAGYKREGLLRKERLTSKGKFVDHYIYAKVR